ncbi:hypothetical protein [Falsiroseomonas bella]|nr:hypothetical protein [Falsiroseomonas bella]
MRRFLPSDPLELSAGAGARLMLAAGVLAVLWAAVAWAMSQG